MKELGTVENNNPNPPDTENQTKENTGDHPSVRPRLSFEHIIPGAIPDQPEPDRDPDIPAFDLNQQSLAGYRRHAAARRKGPAQRQNNASKGFPLPTPPKKGSGVLGLFDQEAHPLVAAIVRRDIEKLCRGELVFGRRLE